MERYGPQLDTIARHRGVGAREDMAVGLLLGAIAEALRDTTPEPRPEITPVGPWPEAQRHAEEQQRERDEDDEKILRLLGRR